MLSNPKTSILGIVAGLAQVAGKAFPDYKNVCDAVSALCVALLGVMAADSARKAK